jgi:hypothetical protein
MLPVLTCSRSEPGECLVGWGALASDAPWACAVAIWEMPGTLRSATRVSPEYGVFKPFGLFIRIQMVSSGFGCGTVVVAVELHAQLNAFPAAFQAMLIGVA